MAASKGRLVGIELLKNTAWGALGELAARGAKASQLVLMARILGAQEIGRFNYALALAGLFSMLFDFGAATVALRDLAANPTGPALRVYARVKLLTSILGVLLVTTAAIWLSLPTTDCYVLVGLALHLAISDFSIYVVVAYRTRGEFWRETLWRTIFALMQLSGTAVALLLTRRVEWVVVALLATAGVGILPLIIELIRSPTKEVNSISGGFAKAVRECIPIAGTVLVGAVYMNFDVVALGKSVTLTEVGWYSVAVKTVFSLLIMPLVYFQVATLPFFAADSSNGLSTSTRNRWLQAFVLSTTTGAVVMLATGLTARKLLTVVFGSKFAAGAQVLVAYVFVGFCFYLYTPLAQWLLLLRRQRWTLYIQVLATVANVVLVLICVPRWGVWGAVVAAIITHGTILVGHFAVVWMAGGFSMREDAWASVFRLSVGLVLAIFTLRAGDGLGLVTKILAITLFAVCAYRELVGLVRYVAIWFSGTHPRLRGEAVAD